MDETERPRKLRKLSHDAATPVASQSKEHGDTHVADHALSENSSHITQSDAADATALPNVQSVEGSSNGAVLQPDTHAASEGMSKNQLKKLRKKAEWEAGRDDRKVIRKEKAVAKRERKQAAKQAAIADGTYIEPEAQPTTRPIQLPITIVIDCDFDDLMSENERMSLGSQITRSYSDNKKAPYRAHLTISSFGGHLKERFDGLLKKMHESWAGVRFLQGDFVDAAEQARTWMEAPRQSLVGGAFQSLDDVFKTDLDRLKEEGEVVYLSSDADDTLEELKPFSTYIIGGLVDRNREKGLCHRRATERGIRTARLPIGSYLDMQSRKILATNHVNEIMLRWLELGDWGEAFMKVIPKRKGGTLKAHTHDDD